MTSILFFRWRFYLVRGQSYDCLKFRFWYSIFLAVKVCFLAVNYLLAICMLPLIIKSKIAYYTVYWIICDVPWLKDIYNTWLEWKVNFLYFWALILKFWANFNNQSQPYFYKKKLDSKLEQKNLAQSCNVAIVFFC